MGGLVLFLFYGSIIFCVIAGAGRLVAVMRLPLHLKWEFYRESSVYEQVDWWTKTPVSFWQKAGTMILDVLFLREYFRRNRSFWTYLYMFHLGIYLLIVWHVWLFLAVAIVDPETVSSIGLVWGHAATALAFIGGLGILVKRITDEELSIYYPPIHYIKWVILLLTLLGGFYAVFFCMQDSARELFKYVRSQITFSDFEHKLHPPPATAAHVLLVAFWLVYLPFSHVMRLFLRYYHYLRDDEVPNPSGGPMEKRIGELLRQQVAWSAPHIQTGKSWAEVATDLSGFAKKPKEQVK